MSGAETRRAWAYLSRVSETPSRALHQLIESHGPEEAAHRIRTHAVTRGLLSSTQARHHLDVAEADLDQVAAAGGRLVTPDDDEWPAWQLLAFGRVDPPHDPLLANKDPIAPVALWVRGRADLTEVTQRAVAMVGTRDVSGYGERVTAEFCHDLVAEGFTVVSGAAYGVDGAAHRAVLSAGGTTVAVLACGVDLAYPAGHASLLSRIAESGLVVSEYPPGTSAARYRFLARNRLVAGLAQAAVVVEAGWRSGARSTITWARSLGRPAMAVPGPITSIGSTGCHRMIRLSEADLVTSAAEIRELAGRVGELSEEPVPDAGPLAQLRDLPASVGRVYEALAARGSRTQPQLSESSGVAPPTVRAALAQLELTGLVERGEQGWCRTRHARGDA